MITQDLEQIEALLHEWEADQDETSTYACHPEQALMDMRALMEAIQQNYEELYELRTRLTVSMMALARSRRNMEKARTILAREDGASWADAIEDADHVLRAAIDLNQNIADTLGITTCDTDGEDQ